MLNVYFHSLVPALEKANASLSSGSYGTLRARPMPVQGGPRKQLRVRTPLDLIAAIGHDDLAIARRRGEKTLAPAGAIETRPCAVRWPIERLLRFLEQLAAGGFFAKVVVAFQEL